MKTCVIDKLRGGGDICIDSYFTPAESKKIESVDILAAELRKDSREYLDVLCLHQPTPEVLHLCHVALRFTAKLNTHMYHKLTQ